MNGNKENAMMSFVLKEYVDMASIAKLFNSSLNTTLNKKINQSTLHIQSLTLTLDFKISLQKLQIPHLDM